MDHRYTVELRIWGETLDPDQITHETGLNPCQIRRAGELRNGSIEPRSLWAFDGGDPHDWDSLEAGLLFVLDSLRGTESLFHKYGSNYDLVWWCGHFQNTFDGGPVLSPGLLGRMGGFGAQLFIDNYFEPDGR